VQAINALKILWSPILPHTCQKLHEMLAEDGRLFGAQKVEEYQEESRSHLALTYDPAGAVGRWQRTEIPVGRELPKPKPLFKKLDESVVADELARLGPRPE